jgi:hypothetical protein
LMVRYFDIVRKRLHDLVPKRCVLCDAVKAYT